jgi:hypothetical protein
MRCQFSSDSLDSWDVRLDRQVVPVNDIFWYLRSILQSDGGIEKDVSHGIRAGWVKVAIEIWHSLWQKSS